MGCEVWIVPVVAVAVWIITTLLKGAEEKPEPRRRPREDSEERAQPPVELDKFLAEVRRRKQGGSSRQRPREEPPVVLQVEPVHQRVEDRPTPGQLSSPPAPRPRPAPPAPRQPEPLPSPRRPPAEAPAARRERQPPKRPQRSERAASAAPLEVIPLEVLPVEPLRVADVSLGSAEVGQAGTVHKAKQTAQQERLAALLRSPLDLRNAIVLQEVFSPPLCHRRHR